MNLETAIREKVHTLPVEQQEEVLEFVEALAKKPPRRKTLTKLIQEHFKDIPPENLDKLPADGSYNLDHYTYGSPKK